MKNFFLIIFISTFFAFNSIAQDFYYISIEQEDCGNSVQLCVEPYDQQVAVYEWYLPGGFDPILIETDTIDNCIFLENWGPGTFTIE